MGLASETRMRMMRLVTVGPYFRPSIAQTQMEEGRR